MDQTASDSSGDMSCTEALAEASDQRSKSLK